MECLSATQPLILILNFGEFAKTIKTFPAKAMLTIERLPFGFNFLAV
jgi:hypothetical protein